MVIVSCSAKFHAFAMAEQLEKHGQLSRFYTCFASYKNSWAKYFVRRKDQEQIPSKKTTANLLLAAGHKLYMKPWIWNEQFDLWVANQLKKNKGEYELFIGWSGMSLHSIRQAKQEGKITIVERGSSHIQYQDRILHEEYKKFGIQFRVNPIVLQKELKEYEEADYISIPSTFVKNSFLEYGIPEEKLLLNPYGTSSLFQIKEPLPKDDTFRILYLGRLSIRKGLIYLFEALHQISRQYKNIEAHFIGTIDPEVQKIIDTFEGIHNNWHFFGHLPQQELPQYIGRCDVAVHPSLEEGLSTVIPQILSCGVPVIATTNTGGGDIIHEDKTGYIVPIRSSSAIAEKLRYLIENPQPLEDLKENNRTQQQHYNWDHYGDNWGKCINTLLTDKK